MKRPTPRRWIGAERVRPMLLGSTDVGARLDGKMSIWVMADEGLVLLAVVGTVWGGRRFYSPARAVSLKKYARSLAERARQPWEEVHKCKR